MRGQLAIDSSQPVTAEPESWRDLLRTAVRDPVRLLQRLNLADELPPGALAATKDYPVRVPEPYLERIRPGDPHDPLLRQVVPLAAERAPDPLGFSPDPLGEQALSDGSGVLRKYAGRALLVATGACAVHCRYCFRRTYPYAAEAGWQSAVEQLAQHGAPAEVILSGGDPLMLDDDALTALLDRLERLDGLRRIRIHTRLPIAIPQRVTATLTARLAQSPLPIVVVVHSNHPQELDTATTTALSRLAGVASAVFNQAVLLRGVNDAPAPLIELSERLFRVGVLPYYLHLLDPVRGTAHFEVEEERARRIMSQVSAALPGYLVPRLARETPHRAAKTVLGYVAPTTLLSPGTTKDSGTMVRIAPPGPP